MNRWLLGAASGWILPAAVAHAAEDNACRLLRVPSVDMSISAASHVTVPMTIGGRDFTLAIDTGGVDSMLNQSVVDSLGLHAERFNNVILTMFGGPRIDHVVKAHGIVFGGLRARDMQVLVLPDGPIMGDVQG